MSDQPPSSMPPPPPPGPGMPSQVPPPGQSPAPMSRAGTAGLISQFRGNAGWACLVGIVTIVVPLAFNRVYFFLPIIGLILGIYAIVRKQVIGGVVGVVLNVVGGILTIIGLTAG